jgi:hypothetical protein
LFISIERHHQPMTSPVLIQVTERPSQPAAFRMLFRVDDTFRVDQRDADAHLSSIVLPDMRVNRVTFGGYATEAACRRHLAALAACASSALPAVWYVAVYNSPWHVFNRTNQVFFER